MFFSKYFLKVNEALEVTSKYSGKNKESLKDIEVTKEVYTEALSKNKVYFFAENQLTEKKRYSPLNCLIPFKEVSKNNVKVEHREGHSWLIEDGKVWMGNSYAHMEELYHQVSIAKGSVFVGGLGLGILVLLLEEKDEVESIHVSELNKDVIDIFLKQEFKLTKTIIVNENVYEAEGSYDTILLDYYNTIPKKNERDLLKVKGLNCSWYLIDKQDVEIIKLDTLISKVLTKQNIPGKAYLKVLWKKYLTEVKEKSIFPISKDSEVVPHLFIYNISNKTIEAIQGMWSYNGENFSAKYSRGEFTDLYVIKENYSEELSFDGKSCKAFYPGGSNKYDVNNNLVQVNIPITDKNRGRLPKLPDFIDVDDVIYHSYKPYGEVVEVNLKSFL